MLPDAQSAGKQHARVITSLFSIVLPACRGKHKVPFMQFQLRMIGLADAYPSAVLLHGYVRCQSYSSTLIPALAHSTAYIGLSSTNTLAPSSLQHQLLHYCITGMCYPGNITGKWMVMNSDFGASYTHTVNQSTALVHAVVPVSDHRKHKA